MNMGRDEKVHNAWLDVARDLGRQDREGEVYLLRTEIERLRAALKDIAGDDYLPDGIRAIEIARRTLEPVAAACVHPAPLTP
ncbi:MAG TPA: hypothetical protein VLL28_02590 [Hyphomicrobiaceae bacterium]|nr:hypothetical protein [Hyphomicrobiaceae bacterium]